MNKDTQNWIVTGAAGFIGGRVAQSLLASGHQVTAVDTEQAFAARQELKDLCFSKTLTPEEFLTQLIAPSADAPPLNILHMGAITDTFEMDEAKLRRQNLEYSQTLWNYCTQTQSQLFYASSAATYGGGEQGYSDAPNAPWNKLSPLNPYGWSKHHFDLFVREQSAKGRTPRRWAGFKFFNVYGFGEAHKGRMASVVWHAYRQIQNGGRVQLFRSHKEGVADGQQSRDFVAVQDVVAVLERFALGTGLKNGIYNLGSGKARSFLDLAQAVFQTLGLPAQIDWVDTPLAIRERYQYFTQASLTELRDAGYSAPFLGLEDGVKAAVLAWQDAGIKT